MNFILFPYIFQISKCFLLFTLRAINQKCRISTKFISLEEEEEVRQRLTNADSRCPTEGSDGYRTCAFLTQGRSCPRLFLTAFTRWKHRRSAGRLCVTVSSCFLNAFLHQIRVPLMDFQWLVVAFLIRTHLKLGILLFSRTVFCAYDDTGTIFGICN